MMELDEREKDALGEIFNVGMSRAAKQLSILLNQEIELTIPEVLLDGAAKVKNEILGDKNLYTYVYQDSYADLEGRMMLIFKSSQTDYLTDIIIGETSGSSNIQNTKSYSKEAMLEVGNIVISSCVSAISNMLALKVQLSIPSYNISDSDSIFEDYGQDGHSNQSKQLILIRTDLKTKSENFNGYLIMALKHLEMTNLMHKINQII